MRFSEKKIRSPLGMPTKVPSAARKKQARSKQHRAAKKAFDEQLEATRETRLAEIAEKLNEHGGGDDGDTPTTYESKDLVQSIKDLAENVKNMTEAPASDDKTEQQQHHATRELAECHKCGAMSANEGWLLPESGMCAHCALVSARA